MKHRQTDPKSAVMRIIAGKERHMSAEDVKKNLDQEGESISLATVYRNLNYLCQEGMIRKVTGSDFSFFDGNAVPHDHIRCVCCGRIADLDSYNAEDDQRIAHSSGFVSVHHTTVYEGICEKCQSEEEKRHGTERIKD